MASTADPTKQTHEVSAADERTPLLNAPDTAGSKAISQSVSQIGNENGDLGHSPSDQDGSQQTPGPHEEDEDKPMPYLQVVILCYASLVEPVAYFAIFPIIGEMLEHTGGVAIADIGFWAGLIEALFSIVQMLLMIFYGKLADRIGRKPVLVWSLGGIAAASAVFGLSQKLWHMILLRCMAGVFAGSSVTIRAMLSEVTTKRTQARAFSWYMFAKNLGIFIGPLIGIDLTPSPIQHRPRLMWTRWRTCRPSGKSPGLQRRRLLREVPVCALNIRHGRILCLHGDSQLCGAEGSKFHLDSTGKECLLTSLLFPDSQDGGKGWPKAGTSNDDPRTPQIPRRGYGHLRLRAHHAARSGLYCS